MRGHQSLNLPSLLYKNLESENIRSAHHGATDTIAEIDVVGRHSGYFPWNHGKFICKGEGKWSCTGLRSYRSYGSEVTE